MIDVVGYALLIMLASLVGVLSVWKRIGKIIEKNLHFLVSFSAGVFLVVAYELSVEISADAITNQNGIMWILLGAATIFLLFRFLPDYHHHHDKEHEPHTHSRIDARRILLGDAIHNIGDGILLATSFGINSTFGITTAIAIFIHELVQEVSEFFVLREAGYSTKQALKLNFLVSSTILIGALGGFSLLGTFEALEIPLLAFAAGSFFVVVFHDLIPHSIRSSHGKRHHLQHIVWFLIGILFMTGINMVTQDAHAHKLEDTHSSKEIHEF